MTEKQRQIFNRLELECIHFAQSGRGLVFVFKAFNELAQELWANRPNSQEL